MRVAICVAATLLAMAAVASAQTPPAATGGACALLTKDDAAAALGEAVTGPEARTMPGGPSTCEYSGSGIHVVHLNVIPLTASTAAMYKAMCAQKGKEGLTGLGDVTCWYNDKHGELQVLKGLTFFSIELRKSGDPTEAIKGVARKVYNRLNRKRRRGRATRRGLALPSEKTGVQNFQRALSRKIRGAGIAAADAASMPPVDSGFR